LVSECIDKYRDVGDEEAISFNVYRDATFKEDFCDWKSIDGFLYYPSYNYCDIFYRLYEIVVYNIFPIPLTNSGELIKNQDNIFNFHKYM